MTLTPRVSVILPNYNHGRYLPARIDSILNQQYKDFELIILDDFSIDDSRAIIEQYRYHPKVSHVLLNESNSGSPFLQWQKGIELAKGEYLWIAESDDSAHEDFLMVLMEHLDRGVGLVYCRSLVIDEEGKRIEGYYWPDNFHSERWKSDYSNNGLAEICNFLVYGNTIPNVSACVFRKESFVMTSEISKMKYCGDWLFWINYLKRSSIYFVSEPLSYHRLHTQSTRGVKNRELEILRYAEYWSVVKHARASCGKPNIANCELASYRWIFEELYRKAVVVGFFSILFRCVPPGLIFPYCRFFCKKVAYRLLNRQYS